MKAGIILVDKPLGISSAQVVARVKRAIKPDKIGHAGTLDPMASGLLVCLIGAATRLAQFAEGGTKTYSGTFKFGITTETDDCDGAILSTQPVSFSESDLLAAAAPFRGEIRQVPPKVSAVKIDGVRAYDKVRRNEEVEIEPRRVVIEDLSLEFLPPDRARYHVRCSKGTYIRSIARDIGGLLGCGGAVETLRRERSEPFSVTEATPLDEVTPGVILPWQRLFPESPYLELSGDEVLALAGGDQRCLANVALLARAEGILQNEKVAPKLFLYGLANVREPQGVLLRESGKLRLGLHVPTQVNL